MLTRYSKYAVAAAIAGACGYAGAATTVITPVDAEPVSLEGSAAAAVTAELVTSAVVNIDINLTNGDLIRMNLGGASFASAAGMSPTLTCTNNAGTTTDVTFSLDPHTSNRVQALVTAVSGSTTGVSCAFGQLDILARGLTGNVTLTGDVVTTGGVSRDDNQGTAASIVAYSVRSQLVSFSVQSAWNGIIDFENSLGYGFRDDDGNGLVGGDEDALAIGVRARDTHLSFTSALSVSFGVRAAGPNGFAFWIQPVVQARPLVKSIDLVRWLVLVPQV